MLEVESNLKAIVPGFAKKSEFWQAQVRDVFNRNADRAVEELRSGSPVGATRQLQEGWQSTPARKSGNVSEVSVKITNTAPNAYYRIAGRGPGGFPPSAPIEAWVRAKSLASGEKEVRSRAFLIRRKIAREGTERWKAKRNWAGLLIGGKFAADSPVAKAENRIRKELKKLKL